jgi:hypothetical protein
MLSPGSGKDRRFAGLKDLFNHLNAVGSRYAYVMRSTRFWPCALGDQQWPPWCASTVREARLQQKVKQCEQRIACVLILQGSGSHRQQEQGETAGG